MAWRIFRSPATNLTNGTEAAKIISTLLKVIWFVQTCNKVSNLSRIQILPSCSTEREVQTEYWSLNGNRFSSISSSFFSIRTLSKLICWHFDGIAKSIEKSNRLLNANRQKGSKTFEKTLSHSPAEHPAVPKRINERILRRIENENVENIVWNRLHKNWLHWSAWSMVNWLRQNIAFSRFACASIAPNLSAHSLTHAPSVCISSYCK